MQNFWHGGKNLAMGMGNWMEKFDMARKISAWLKILPCPEKFQHVVNAGMIKHAMRT
jgi:hypothetical protein